MIYTIKLRLKSAILGDSWNGRRRVHEFPREDGAWKLDHNTLHTWGGLIQNAATTLGLNIDVDSIRLPSSLLLPTVHLYQRNHRMRHEDKQRVINHEMLPRNVVLTLQVMIRETDGRQPLKYPDTAQLHGIFKVIGEYEGISPYGGAFGFGRFTVQSVSLMGRTAIDLSELPGGGGEGADVRRQEDGGSGGEEKDGVDDPAGV